VTRPKPDPGPKRSTDLALVGKEAALVVSHGGAMIYQLHLDRGIDLDLLVRMLQRLFAGHHPAGRVSGIERVTRAVGWLMGCPNDSAQQVVAALMFRRQLVVYLDERGREFWIFRGPPACC
jgi:hypothetical protein